jgi:hypothetical protein
MDFFAVYFEKFAGFGFVAFKKYQNHPEIILTMLSEEHYVRKMR